MPNFRAQQTNMVGETSSEKLSLLGQIVTAIERLDDVQKQALLIQLRKNELLQKAAALGNRLLPDTLSDEEILALCKTSRKERYARG